LRNVVGKKKKIPCQQGDQMQHKAQNLVLPNRAELPKNICNKSDNCLTKHPTEIAQLYLNPTKMFSFH